MTPYQIFIPESIPLENKGEEAILRGIEDTLFPDGDVHFHLLAGNCDRPKTVGNLTLYPRKWFYTPLVFRELRWSFDPLDMLNVAGVLMEAFQNRFPFLAKRAHWEVIVNENLITKGRFLFFDMPTRRAALRDLMNVDFVLAGHDNAFGLREAHILKSLVAQGLHFGIYGCGMNTRFVNQSVVDAYRSAFEHAEFLFFRDPETYAGMSAHFSDLRPVLAPDPAFGMRPCAPAVVAEIIEKENLASFFKKPVVVMTVVENAVLMKSFDDVKLWADKLVAHRKLVAALVDHITTVWDANVLFLPHCIGPTTNLDDRRVARDVFPYLKAGTDRVRVLETEYPARELKGLISSAELLIGERTHSLIGAVSTATPFICLGSLRDRRTTGILGDMCESRHLIYDLASPNAGALLDFADNIWGQRCKIREDLTGISQRIRGELTSASNIIRASIERNAYAERARLS